MKKTLLCIDTHSGVSDFLPSMWKHYEKSGCDIVGCNRSNKATTFPYSIPQIAYGEDVFKRWCEHKSPTLLNDRMLGVMETLLMDERFADYDNFCQSTWSVLFPRPLPEHPGGIVLCRTGGPKEGFKAKQFFHDPWWYDRPTGRLLAKTGRELLAKGEYELGSNDFFFGLMIDTAGIKWHEAPAYSKNALDGPTSVDEAKTHIRQGAWWIGGVKNKDQLNALIN